MIPKENELLDTKTVANYSQKVRLDVIGEICKSGRLTDNLEKTEVLLKTLADLDRTNLGMARIKIEEKKVNDDGALLDIVSSLLKNVNMSTSSFINNNHNNDMQSLNRRLEEVVLEEVNDVVHGELDRGFIEITYDSFMGANKD